MGGAVVMSDAELEAKDAVAACREKIIQRINCIDNVVFLEFVNNMLDAFKRKWGI